MTKFPPKPRGKFKVIYADPPWAYACYDGKDRLPQRADAQWYETLKLEELKALPVADMADKDCLLIIWSTSSHVKQCFELAESWGFEYRSLGPVWAKVVNDEERMEPAEDLHTKMSMGHWFRQEAEVAYVFGRGKPKRTGKGVRQFIARPRREHSRKPDEYYPRIEALIDGPYLELFSRTSRQGWTVWGNQTGKFGKRTRSLSDLLGK